MGIDPAQLIDTEWFGSYLSGVADRLLAVEGDTAKTALEIQNYRPTKHFNGPGIRLSGIELWSIYQKFYDRWLTDSNGLPHFLEAARARRIAATQQAENVR